MPSPVPRIGRILDLVGLGLLLAGGGLYGWAWLGMRRLESVQPVSREAGDFAAMARFQDLWELSRVGLAVMVLGVLTAVAAMVVARVLSRRAEGD